MDRSHSDATLPNQPHLSVFNQCPAALHFRFLCRTASAEQRLLDSLGRAWSELRDYFPDLPILLDISNHYHLGLFPFQEHALNELTQWEVWEPTLYTDPSGEFVSGSMECVENAVPVDAPWLKKLYAEQFVVRVSLLWVAETNDIADAEQMVFNLLQNADVPGVTLLSLEEVVPDGFEMINTENVLPDISERESGQPLLGLLHRDTTVSSPIDLGFFDRHRLSLAERRWSENEILEPISFFVDDGENGIVETTSLRLDVQGELPGHPSYVSLMQSYSTQSGGYGKSPVLIGTKSSGIDWPVWRCISDGDVMNIMRMVMLPKSTSVDDVFYAARGYPVCSKFGDRMGVEYINLISVGDIPGLNAAIQSGFMMERDVLTDGQVVFRAYFPQMEEQHITGSLKVVHVFTGSETLTESFLNKLSTVWRNDPYPNLDDAMFLASELGGAPSASVPDVARAHLIN